VSIGASGLRDRAMGTMARQFARPAGPVGRIVARLLARGNGGFNRWVIEELNSSLPAPDTVIELGCGPGIALQQLLAAHPTAEIVGIDLSRVVLKSAERRNRKATSAGRLRLVNGDARTAGAHGPADLIVACHVLYFWREPVVELEAIRRALTPTGHLALGYQLRQNMPPVSQHAFPAEGYKLYDSDDQIAAIFMEAGFTRPQVRVWGDTDRPNGRLALATPGSD
jgi:SAM-dependent methyltransferase